MTILKPFRIGLLAVLLVSFTLSQAVAQAAAATATPAQVTAPSADDINKLANTLNDPAARAALIQQLHLLADAQKQAEPQQAPVEAFSSKLIATLNDHYSALGDELTGLAQAFSDFPHLEQYVEHQTENPQTRAHWIDIGSEVFLVIGIGLLVYVTNQDRRAHFMPATGSAAARNRMRAC